MSLEVISDDCILMLHNACCGVLSLCSANVIQRVIRAIDGVISIINSRMALVIPRQFHISRESPAISQALRDNILHVARAAMSVYYNASFEYVFGTVIDCYGCILMIDPTDFNISNTKKYIGDHSIYVNMSGDKIVHIGCGNDCTCKKRNFVRLIGSFSRAQYVKDIAIDWVKYIHDTHETMRVNRQFNIPALQSVACSAAHLITPRVRLMMDNLAGSLGPKNIIVLRMFYAIITKFMSTPDQNIEIYREIIKSVADHAMFRGSLMDSYMYARSPRGENTGCIIIAVCSALNAISIEIQNNHDRYGGRICYTNDNELLIHNCSGKAYCRINPRSDDQHMPPRKRIKFTTACGDV